MSYLWWVLRVIIDLYLTIHAVAPGKDLLTPGESGNETQNDQTTIKENQNLRFHLRSV